MPGLHAILRKYNNYADCLFLENKKETMEFYGYKRKLMKKHPAHHQRLKAIKNSQMVNQVKDANRRLC